MNRNSFLLGVLVGAALLASIGAANVQVQVGRYQITQTHYQVMSNSAVYAQVDLPIKIDTVTGKTWGYYENSIGGASGAGLISMEGWAELNDTMKTSHIPGAKTTK